jgi:GNAT superfamily N-acetyltransferase
MTVRIDESLEGIDWAQAKADLTADDFDNGRSPGALRASFERSQHVVIARDGDRVVGMARLLSDGVCNAYLLDVWTMSAYRRQGIGAAMVRQLMARAPASTSACKPTTRKRSTPRSATGTSPSSCPLSPANGSSTRPTKHDRPVRPYLNH